jgi:hypothetical protein
MYNIVKQGVRKFAVRKFAALPLTHKLVDGSFCQVQGRLLDNRHKVAGKKLGFEMFYDRGNYLNLPDKKELFYLPRNNIRANVKKGVTFRAASRKIINAPIKEHRNSFKFVYFLAQGIFMLTTAHIPHEMGL